MANELHLATLKRGKTAWNNWKANHPYHKVNLDGIHLSGKDLSQFDLSGVNFSNSILRGVNLCDADLSGANLSGTDLTGAHLRGADLTYANLSKAYLKYTDLSGANLSQTNLEGTRFYRPVVRGINLSGAILNGINFTGINLSDANLHRINFSKANLSKADFSNADLSEADLSEADLSYTTLSKANLHGAILRYANLNRASLSRTVLTNADLLGANLSGTTLIRTNLDGADLTGCHVYGISVWDVNLEGTLQFNLTITPNDEPAITVDNLEVAQFVYLLLNNAKIRYIIDTITTKVVLILGRFTRERKVILDALREELRNHEKIPVLFDFEKPSHRDLTETVRTLAHLARFIIADITDPSSIPLELQAIIPHLSVPVQPILLAGNREFSMFVDLRKYQWVLPVYFYEDQATLIETLKEKVIDPAEKKAQELEKRSFL